MRLSLLDYPNPASTCNTITRAHLGTFSKVDGALCGTPELGAAIEGAHNRVRQSAQLRLHRRERPTDDALHRRIGVVWVGCRLAPRWHAHDDLILWDSLALPTGETWNKRSGLWCSSNMNVFCRLVTA